MSMSKDIKEKIQYISSIVMLFFGMILCVLGFYTEPIGEIHGSILAIFGQILVFSGAIFGLSIYIRDKYDCELNNFKNEVRKEIKEK